MASAPSTIRSTIHAHPTISEALLSHSIIALPLPYIGNTPIFTSYPSDFACSSVNPTPASSGFVYTQYGTVLKSIAVFTAGVSGGDITINGLPEEIAEGINHHIRGTISAEKTEDGGDA